MVKKGKWTVPGSYYYCYYSRTLPSQVLCYRIQREVRRLVYHVDSILPTLECNKKANLSTFSYLLNLYWARKNWVSCPEWLPFSDYCSGLYKSIVSIYSITLNIFCRMSIECVDPEIACDVFQPNWDASRHSLFFTKPPHKSNLRPLSYQHMHCLFFSWFSVVLFLILQRSSYNVCRFI